MLKNVNLLIILYEESLEKRNMYTCIYDFVSYVTEVHAL